MALRLGGSRTIILGAIAVAAVATAYWYWQGWGGDGTARLTYQTAEAERGTISQTVTASGKVEALVTVEVGSQLSGQIKEIYVDFNDVVTDGQLLALIDPQTFEMRVTSADADLTVARSNVQVREAGVTKATALLDQAKRELNRQRALAKRGNVSQSTLDAAETAVRAAKADLAVAQSELDNARSIVRQRDATLGQAKVDLDRTQIRSPIDGVVISRNVDVGQTVAASLQAPVLFVIAQDLSKIQIEASVNEADVGRISAGNTVRFTVDAFPERPFRGEVKQVRLAPTELQNVVTYTVIVEAQNPGQRLFPGMTATAEIVTGERDDVLRVPAQAVRYWPANVERPDRQAGFRTIIQGMRAILAAELELTDDQKAKLQEARESRRGARGQGGGRRGRGGRGGAGGGRRGGFDPSAMQARMYERLKESLDPILTPDQKTRFSELEDAFKSGTVGVVWVLKSGVPERRDVLTGLSDGRFIEVMAGNLKEGEPVIVRATEVTRSN